MHFVPGAFVFSPQVKDQKPPAPTRGLSPSADVEEEEEAEGEGQPEETEVQDLVPRTDIRYTISFHSSVPNCT